MKRNLTVSIIFSLVISFIAQATAITTTSDEQPTFIPANIYLQSALEDNKVRLNWTTTDGKAPKGYKIVWSLFANPEFPIRQNDYFNTIASESTQTAIIDYFLNRGKYFARICVYDGIESCLKYSNEITFFVEEELDEETNEKTFIVTEIIESGTGTQTEPEHLEPEDQTENESQNELPETPALNDIKNHHNEEAILYLYEQGIVSGYSDGTYKPDNKINRAEFTKIITEATIVTFDIENCLIEYESDKIFDDVSTTEWYSKYICAAKKNKYIHGYLDGSFKPAQEISFVEAAKIITLGFWEKLEEGDIWYEPFVNYLSTLHAIPETIKALDYHITRADMAEIIYRLKLKITDKPFVTYKQLKS
jgi:hypothetical protein